MSKAIRGLNFSIFAVVSDTLSLYLCCLQTKQYCDWFRRLLITGVNLIGHCPWSRKESEFLMCRFVWVSSHSSPVYSSFRLAERGPLTGCVVVLYKFTVTNTMPFNDLKADFVCCFCCFLLAFRKRFHPELHTWICNLCKLTVFRSFSPLILKQPSVSIFLNYHTSVLDLFMIQSFRILFYFQGYLSASMM